MSLLSDSPARTSPPHTPSLPPLFLLLLRPSGVSPGSPVSLSTSSCLQTPLRLDGVALSILYASSSFEVSAGTGGRLLSAWPGPQYPRLIQAPCDWGQLKGRSWSWISSRTSEQEVYEAGGRSADPSCLNTVLLGRGQALTRLSECQCRSSQEVSGKWEGGGQPFFTTL
ncbi:unnamed protein product [Boreogadus saida]